MFNPRPLPLPLTPLVGRKTEAAEIVARLLDPHLRLLTVTGPGGVGKTRLAIEAASTAALHFADGVAFVDLALIQEPKLVGAAISQALNIRESGDRPVAERLVDQFRHRHLLLVLDNVEHLLPGVPVVTELLALCPRLTVLATSRAPLRIDGEHIVAVPPLSLPAPDSVDASQSDAVRLFVERVAAVRAGFALTVGNAAAIGEICRRLDGLPLAIELAAARCLVLSPEVLLTHLGRRLPLLDSGRRDAPARMRSLRGAISWSHDLLTPEEQVAFRRLAVFTGGFPLEAAGAVWDAEGVKAIDLATSLTAQNLITRQDRPGGDLRFEMLETIREFALERLLATGEETETRRCHAEYFLSQIQHVSRVVPRPDRWWELFDTEWSNLRAALAWAAQTGESEIGLRLAGELFRYWMLRGQVSEGIVWSERLLAAGAVDEPVLRARAEMAVGFLHWVAGDLDRADALAASGLVLSESSDDSLGSALGWFLSGFLAEARGDFAAAARHFSAARGLHLEAGQEVAAAAMAAHLGRVIGRQGDLAAAEHLLAGATAILDREDGGHWGAATAYTDLGLVVAERDPRQGAVCVWEGLRRQRDLGDRLATLVSLAAAAMVAALDKQAEAARILGTAASMRAQSGPSIWAIARPAYEQAAFLAERKLGPLEFRIRFEEGQLLDAETAIANAMSSMTRVTASTPPTLPGVAAPTPALSPRELAVLRLITEGKTDQEVANLLGLRLRTVNTHVANARRKLSAPSRAAAVAEVVRRGLV